MTLISTACSWVSILGGQKAAIIAQVGQFYFDEVGQYYSGANNFASNMDSTPRPLNGCATRWSRPRPLKRDQGELANALIKQFARGLTVGFFYTSRFRRSRT
jgi:hypothetical protein